jgi:hypothetical protein
MVSDLRSWTLGEAAPMLAARAALGLAVVIVAVLALSLPGWGGAAIIGAWLGGVGMVTPDTRTNPSMPLLIGWARSASCSARSRTRCCWWRVLRRTPWR